VIVAVLSDVHSNIVALDAVLASIGTVDAVWHLGDVAGYGPEPDAVVERLRGMGAVGVRGNHDEAVLSGSGFRDLNPVAAEAVAWTRAHISASTREFLAGLPLMLVPEGHGFTLVHGSPAAPLSWYTQTRQDAADCLVGVATAHCMVGHTHVPVAFRAARDGHIRPATMTDGDTISFDEWRCVLNPGSVGQPRDGDPRAAFMLLDTGAGRATWRRVAYDIPATQAAILAAGLPTRLATRLAVGQ
jgi:predicted phosphodiesterase